jgi:prevent-host-death family protein
LLEVFQPGTLNPEPLNPSSYKKYYLEVSIMEKMVSKSQFKPRALQYFREVEKTGKELIISDRGKPVLKIVPYTENTEEALKALRNTVIRFEDPTEPVGLEDWEALK